MKKNFTKVIFFPPIKQALKQLGVICRLSCQSLCLPVCLFLFFLQPQAALLRKSSVGNPFCLSRFLRHRWQSQEYDVFPYHSVSAAGNLQRGPGGAKWDCSGRAALVPHRPDPTFKDVFDDFPLLSVAVRRAPIAMHSHPHSCFQHVTSHSWRVARPLCFWGYNFLRWSAAGFRARHMTLSTVGRGAKGEENSSAFFVCFIRVVTFLTQRPWSMRLRSCWCEKSFEIQQKPMPAWGIQIESYFEKLPFEKLYFTQWKQLLIFMRRHHSSICSLLSSSGLHTAVNQTGKRNISTECFASHEHGALHWLDSKIWAHTKQIIHH